MILRTTVLAGYFMLNAFAADEAAGYHDPGLRRVAQVAIVCRNVEACSTRWAAIFGLPAPGEFVTTKVGHEVRMVYRGKPSDARVKMAFLKADNVQLEFLQPVGGDSAWQEGLDKRGEGVHHLGFEVRDLERTISAFKKQGIGVLQRGRYDSDDGTYVYLDSAERLGIIVELLHSAGM